MSGEEENIIPTITLGATLTTQASVPVTVPVTGVPSTTDIGTVLKSTVPYILTRGPRRDSRFDTVLYEDPGYPHYGATEEATVRMCVTDHTRECSDCRLLEEKDYEADARIEMLELGQQEIKQNLEEVILAIPDMV
ncbi:UNVERIFIED_CONTAM: hypothetical protein K2H54_060299 [Gekko kuhli]